MENIQQNQINIRDDHYKEEIKHRNQENSSDDDHQICSSISTTTTTPSSNSSSPSHEFSFTISFQQNKQIPLPFSSSSSTNTTSITSSLSSSFAIDLSPADDIFFHGHLLPLHLLSHFPLSSPRSSTTSLDSFTSSTLPKKDHFFHQEHKVLQNSKNILLDDDTSSLSCSDSSKMLPHPCRILKKYTTFEGSDTHPMTFLKSPSNIASCDAKGKPKTKSFSLFGIQKWRKGYEIKDQEDHNKERSQQYSKKMTQVVKRYIRMVRPFLSFRNNKKNNVQFHRQSYNSFSGNLLRGNNHNEFRGIKGEYSSAPASIRTSPTNSGLLVATPTGRASTGALKLPLCAWSGKGGYNSNCTNNSSCSSSDSTMEELQAAIQAAIAHCKKSISMEDKKIKLP